jgi:hypothetical protein
MASTHRTLGFVAGAGYGHAAGLPWPLTLTAGAIAVVTSAGRLSPDADQFRGWRLADRILPDELLGRGGPMQHRGITHWWGWPTLLTAVWAAGVPLSTGGWSWLAGGALLAGWWSHLVGDMVFGRAVGRYARPDEDQLDGDPDPVYGGRGPGVPLAPWWWHVGVGLKCGGLTEWLLGLALLPVAAWVVAASAGLTP